jgi:hypothetical protein
MSGSIRYVIFHNVDAHWSRGYEPGDRLVRGWTDFVPDESSDESTAERLFGRHNRDDRPDGRLAPSLSVGDVVVLDPDGELRALTCESSGWRVVDVTGADVHDGPYRDVIDGLR